MKELICPNCRKAFKVDEADYAAILMQVKDREFQEDLDRRIAELHKQHEAEQKAAALEANQSYDRALRQKEDRLKEKESAIAQLQLQLNGLEEKKQLELNAQMARKEQEIDRLKAEIKGNDDRV